MSTSNECMQKLRINFGLDDIDDKVEVAKVR